MQMSICQFFLKTSSEPPFLGVSSILYSVTKALHCLYSFLLKFDICLCLTAYYRCQIVKSHIRYYYNAA